MKFVSPRSYLTLVLAPSYGHKEGNNYFDTDNYSGPLPHETNETPMTGLQIAMQREIAGWPLYTIIMALGQMLGATSFQITLLSGQNWQGDLQLYVLSGVFFAASLVWYTMFRLKPSVYVLSIPWLFYAISFFVVALPSVHPIFLPAQKWLTSTATWSYAVASAAAFLYFGLNFGEEAVSGINDRIEHRGFIEHF